jgi:hypothetical protein
MLDQQLNNRTLDQLEQYIPVIASRIELMMQSWIGGDPGYGEVQNLK